MSCSNRTARPLRSRLRKLRPRLLRPRLRKTLLRFVPRAKLRSNTITVAVSARMRAAKIRRRLCRSVVGRADQKCCGECKSAAVVSYEIQPGS
jgi:hypothetical protein